ncbi:MAG: hypothetical protein VW879_04555 [Opitutae bacterium]
MRKRKTQKNKGRNALTISQAMQGPAMSQDFFRMLVESRMDKRRLNEMFGPPEQKGLLRYLKETGQASGPRVRGI